MSPSLTRSDRTDPARLRELTESEARYRTLADLSPDAILVDVAQHVVYANAAAARMLGAASPDALVGRAMHAVLAPEHHARVEVQYAQILQGDGPAAPHMSRWIRVDGSTLEVEVTFARVEWSGLPALQLLARDVTERRRMETQLQKSEERYRLAIAALNGYVYDWEFGSETVHFSPGMQAMLGYEGDERLISWWRSLIHPDDSQELLARSQRALESGREITYSEYRLRHADGRWVWVADHATAAYENGTCTRVVGNVLDITERKQIEAALAASESLHRAIAANLPAGAVFVVGLDMRYQLAAGEALATIGRPPEWIIGRLVQDAAPDHLREQYLAQYRAAFAGETVSSERRIRGRTYLSRAGPLRNDKGAICGALAVSVDITDRKRAEESLRETDRRKDEFLATLAHELRNPLAPIRTAAHILRSPDLTDTQREQAREMIDRQSRHLTRLVDDLMEISRLTLGRIELKCAPVSLATVIDQAIEAAAAAIESHGHVLHIERPAASLLVHGDGVRLAQVLTNLLTNAAKYTPRGGRIDVSARVEGREIVVSVRDTGIGIPPEMLERVFEMFAQVPRTDGLTAGGLGIGLALVRRLVEMHGGHIEARSEGDGRGSEFVVRLPRAAAMPAARESDVLRDVARPSRRVLVVDDNDDAADSLGMALRLMGHDAQVVHGGAAALEALEAAPYDIVFLDIGMPGIDGYEVARRVRARLGGHAPRLVALTGWGQEADRERAIAVGFDHHLTKPADPRRVAELVAGLGGVRSTGPGAAKSGPT